MAYEVVHEALGDAGVSAHELGLVIVGNAMAGRLSDQGVHARPDLAQQGRPQRGRHHQRGQLVRRRELVAAPGDAWRPPPRTARYWRSASRRCGPATAPGRSPALRTASRRSTATTCTTAATRTTIPPAASSWASTTAGRTASWPRSAPRCARSPPPRSKAFEHAARNPLAQFQRRVTIEEVLASPRWPASSPGSCAARSPTARPPSCWAGRRSRPRPRRPVSSARWRVQETACSTTTTG